jgi:(heptosyl)LPS beta-1,4-glucosyltransferase
VAGLADEAIVCDMESEDATLETARRVCPDVIIVPHPRIPHFDRARNVSAMRAKYEHILFLDADERIPPGLIAALLHLIATQSDSFEAMLLPFRHFFAGHWMQCLYPGYTAPRLLKNGRFVFNARLHSGAQVDGRIIAFPADNPDLALVHYSYDSIGHHLEKLNRYTDGESASMHQDGRPFHWQHALRHFVEDMQGYYYRGGAYRDDVHGFIYAFQSGFYRFEQHAKLFERRFQAGQLQPQEQAVPVSVRQMLEYMLQVVCEEPRPQPKAIRVERSVEAAKVLWSGPFRDMSGYGEEIRNFRAATEQAGIPVAVQILPWSDEVVELSAEVRKRLDEAAERTVQPGFVQIMQDFPRGFNRHPEAGFAIGRTMFETDRLP